MVRFAGCSILGLSLTLALGCGSSDVPAGGTFVDIKGTVSISGGKVYKQGMIHFEPETAGQGRSDQAAVRDGAFIVKLMAAKYKVAFDVEATNSPVPPKYRKFATSETSLDATSAKDNVVIDLK